MSLAQLSIRTALSARAALPAAVVPGARLASSLAKGPAMDWTKQSWATLSHIPERVQIEGSDPNARVNADHSNIEFVFPLMSRKAKDDYCKQMAEIAQKDWTTLSINERKALYYVAFGPYGPRRPILPPGSNMRLTVYAVGILAASVGSFAYIQSRHTMPRTMTKEWQEGANEKARTAHMEPFRGLGKQGHVQSS